MYLNKAIIYGNLTRDPELRNLPNGTAVVTLAVATNRTWKDKEGVKKEDVQYHNVVAFGRQAEVIAQYLKKGSGVFVEGRMQTRSWDGQDGQKKYRTEIVVDSFQFGPKSGGQGGAPASTQGFSEAKEGVDQTPPEGAIQYPEEEINPDDIPF